MRFRTKGLLLFLVIWLVAASSVSAEEFKKTFLLEAKARYEVSVKIRTGVEGAPTLASVYIHTQHGEYLRSTQLSRSIAGNNNWQTVSVIVNTPPGGQKATVVFSTEEGVEMQWDDLFIRRVELDMDDEQLIEQGLVYTGLIIDARGLDLERGMSPKIYSQSGQLVYSGVVAPKEYIQEKGIASYGPELSPELLERIRKAGQAPKVSPLVIRAEEVVGNTRTNVVISDDDAEAILEALNIYDFLAEYAVVFLID